MPGYVISRVNELLNSKDKMLRNSKVLVLGVAYKKDISDMRESPALNILELLLEKHVEVSFYDPFVDELKISGQNIKKETTSNNFEKYDMLLVLTPHTEFSEINFASMQNIIFDTTGSNFIQSTERI
jgi:UDP-N-acetyl-D-glucosamine dehydrogenase